jgi:hypothetical protein
MRGFTLIELIAEHDIKGVRCDRCGETRIVPYGRLIK